MANISPPPEIRQTKSSQRSQFARFENDKPVLRAAERTMYVCVTVDTMLELRSRRSVKALQAE
jgi:hypothetical protein